MQEKEGLKTMNPARQRFHGAAAIAVFLCFFFHGFCCAENLSPSYSFMKHAAEAPSVSYHDYIVVGGGAAGCTLAATLAQSFDVLVLERGGSPYGNENISLIANLVKNLAHLTPTSPAQRFVSEDGVINTRARVLGGGTCINAGFYSRASSEEVRQMGLDERLVEQSFRWVESEVVSEPQLTAWTSAYTDGLLAAGVTPYNGFTYEHLTGTKIGGSTFDRDGYRHTAANFLRHADPTKINVLLRATAQRILFRSGAGSAPVAYGVEYRDEAGSVHTAYLKDSAGEIILSAGALGSPQLLMLSGVGPADHLESLGIEVVLDQPLVGHDISDNPMSIIAIPSPEPLEVTSVQVVGIRPSYYVESLTGLNLVAALSGNSDSGDSTVRDSKSHPTSSSDEKDDDVFSFQGGIVVAKLSSPVSRGQLRLKNRNPEDNPSVTYNYYAEAADVEACVAAMETMKRVIDTQGFYKFRYQNQLVQDLIVLSASLIVNNRPRNANDTTSLEQYCKDLVLTIWHYHGGCQVGQVVDSDYKVMGVGALRVVDGSTYSFSPGTNPQATTMMLGRYMGVKIQDEMLKQEQ